MVVPIVQTSQSSWRVFMNSKKDVAQIDDARPIQVQRGHGRTSSGREPNDDGAVLIPCKMISPPVFSRMKNGDYFAGHGISTGGLVVFVIIATLAGPGEVLEQGLTALATRDDVFSRKTLQGETLLASTVFATPAGAFCS
jgi:hypothetical protein